MDTKSRNIWIGVGVGALIVIVIAFIVRRAPEAAPAPSVASGNATENNLPPSPATSSYAAAGQLVKGFPQQLVLDTKASVGQSYSIKYTTQNVNQYTAQWNSSSSLSSEANQYETYFTTNGWKVSVNKTTAPSVRAVSAATSSGYALVNISEEGTGSEVTVTYVAN